MTNRNVVQIGVAVALFIACSGIAHGETPLPPDATGKYKLNLQAYQGITFAEMFGTVPISQVQPQAEDPNAQTEPIGTCISLGAFIDRLQRNIATLTNEGTSQSDVDLVAEVLAYLKAYVDGATLPNGSSVKRLRVRSFCEADLREKFSQTVAAKSPQGEKTEGGKNTVVPNEVIAGLYLHFDALETAGLTLPWTLVTQNKKFDAFRSLVYGTRFLQRAGRLTYADFFMIGMDDPLVDDELLDVTQYAIEVGLFGAIHAYRGSPCATVTVETLSPMGPLPNSCCDRATRKCMFIGNPNSNCGPTGSACPLGATSCP